MKVFFYLPNVESGGAEKMIIALANELAIKGQDVTLVLGICMGAFKNDISEEVEVLELGTLSVLKSATKLYKTVLKNKPDILCVTKCHVNTIISLFTLFLKKTKVVLREANTPSIEYRYASNYAKIIMLLGKLTYKLADKYVAVSKGVAEDMTAFYGLKKNKVQAIYNPVISQKLYEFSNKGVNHPFLAEKDNDSDVYILIAVGRLMPQKDYPSMIEAFTKAYRKNKNLRLLILGRVEHNHDYERVKDYINEFSLHDVIDFVGFVNNPYKYLSRADCFIQTSLYEGLPGTLVQALALKKNIIATNCKSGPEEVLNYGEFGSLVEIKNINMISDEIYKYSKGKQNSLANQEFIDKFSSNISANEYLKTFNALCK